MLGAAHNMNAVRSTEFFSSVPSATNNRNHKTGVTTKAQTKGETMKDSLRECVEVLIRPQLSFVSPVTITDQELEDTTGFYREGVGAVKMTVYESVDDGESLRTTLNREMGQLAGWLDGLGYDVKFLGW